MNYVLDLLQGAGIALACGIHPLLPVLLVGGLARANLGVDFGGTSFAFLESGWFLLAVAVALVVSVLFRARLETPPGQAAWGGLAIGLGAVEAAGSLDDRFSTWWPGLLVGAACAALAFAVTSAILTRTRARLDPQAAAALPLYAGGASLLVAGLSVLLPPLALLAGGFFGWLRAAGRRREGQKFAGLRILR